jgi:hypothetical protein
VGYTLVGAIGALCPDDLEVDEWDRMIEGLEAAIRPARSGLRRFLTPPDDEATLAWLDRWLPRCMELVPRRRRARFLEGVYRYTREEENPIDR